MKIVKGNLIALAQRGYFDVIVHGCNCFHTMGAGIAKQIREHFPAAYTADQQTGYGDYGKLGSISAGCLPSPARTLFVVNGYTQYRPGPNVDYNAIREVFNDVKRKFGDLRIGYPRIGAGIAGGDWNRIAGIIDEALAGCDHTLVELP